MFRFNPSRITLVGILFKLFVSILNFQATEQPTRTGTNLTDVCGGTAQLDPKTGVPSRGQRVLLTQIMNFHASILQGKPQSRRCEQKVLTYTKHTKVLLPGKLQQQEVVPGTLLQQLVHITAAHSQQDRRRASDGGRATEGERYMYTANTPVPTVVCRVHISRCRVCISSGATVFNQHKRRRASYGGRAIYEHRKTAYVPGDALLLMCHVGVICRFFLTSD